MNNLEEKKNEFDEKLNGYMDVRKIQRLGQGAKGAAAALRGLHIGSGWIHHQMCRLRLEGSLKV